MRKLFVALSGLAAVLLSPASANAGCLLDCVVHTPVVHVDYVRPVVVHPVHYVQPVVVYRTQPYVYHYGHFGASGVRPVAYHSVPYSTAQLTGIYHYRTWNYYKVSRKYR